MNVSTLPKLINKAKRSPRHIVIAEGSDRRVIKAAFKAHGNNLAKITLLGSLDIQRYMTSIYGDECRDINIVDPETDYQLSNYINEYYALRAHKGITLEEASKAVRKPINYANMMVREGRADGSIAGAATLTASVVRSALQIIGTAPENSIVSSFFMMVFNKDNHNRDDIIIFADCALVVSPNEVELIEIAGTTADSMKKLLGIEPKIAMLSFSTLGSSAHPYATKIANVTEAMKEQRPDLTIDGEMQFDTAFVSAVAEKKARVSKVAGQANIFIFPDLGAGNIGYKIAERIGEMSAIGPILQGLSKPANDLSRGCSVDDIYNMIAITTLQANQFP